MFTYGSQGAEHPEEDNPKSTSGEVTHTEHPPTKLKLSAPAPSGMKGKMLLKGKSKPGPKASTSGLLKSLHPDRPAYISVAAPSRA